MEIKLTTIKAYSIDSARSLTETERQVFWAELCSWAGGMAVPTEVRGKKRTQIIRSFFRGMKGKK